MSYSEIWLFFEGRDDERFLERLVVPSLEREYTCVILYPYAQKKRQNVVKFLTNLQRRGIDYIFFRDMNSCPCATKSKDELHAKYTVLDLNRVVVVISAIEGWYLAGLGPDEADQLKASVPSRTDNIGHAEFDRIVPEHYERSRIPFMRDIIDVFAIDVARDNNPSFRYFTDKYDLAN